MDRSFSISFNFSSNCEIIRRINKKRLHPFISTCKIVGWDIAIDEKGNPTVIEINLEDIGMTDKSQAVNGPLFGEITDNLLNILTQKRRLK